MYSLSEVITHFGGTLVFDKNAFITHYVICNTVHTSHSIKGYIIRFLLNLVLLLMELLCYQKMIFGHVFRIGRSCVEMPMYRKDC